MSHRMFCVWTAHLRIFLLLTGTEFPDIVSNLGDISSLGDVKAGFISKISPKVTDDRLAGG